MCKSLLGLHCATLLCFLLAGCASVHKQQQLSLWRQQEARYYDIPIMMHAQPDYRYQSQEDEGSVIIAYTIEAQYDDAQRYYINHMERFGWRHLSAVVGHEVTLLFEKPQKFCIVSLRPASDRSIHVVISQAYREKEYL